MTFFPVCLSGDFQFVSTGLEKVVRAVLAMLCDKKRCEWKIGLAKQEASLAAHFAICQNDCFLRRFADSANR